MKCVSTATFTITLLALPLLQLGTANAETPAPVQFQAMAASLLDVKADPGLETTKPGPPTWCAEVKITPGAWNPQNQITLRADTSLDRLLDSARFACLWPKEPNVQKAVGLIMQWYVNYTGLSVARATETFKTRVSNKSIATGSTGEDGKDRFHAQQKQLCAALTMPREVDGGEEVEFMTARRKLFGCPVTSATTMEPALWISDSYDVKDTLIAFLDSSVTEVDEAVRLAWLLTRTRYIFTEGRSDLDVQLLTYITDQIDFDLMSEPRLMKLIDAAPYKGNGYARTILLESLANAQLGVRKIKAEVGKRASDAGWKDLLLAAPQRGIAEWTKAAGQHKDAIARSNAFEAKFFGPSKQAIKGCWPELRKDFVEATKMLKRGSAIEFQQELSEPVPSLLFARLVACASIDADRSHTEALRTIDSSLRYQRGPRVAAFYAALDAHPKILADRRKFPIQAEDLRGANHWLFQTRMLDAEVMRNIADAKPRYADIGAADGHSAGTVKAVKNVGDTTRVTFVSTKSQYMGTSCVDSKRIVTWDANNSPIYYRACKDTGMVTFDSTPAEVLIPTAWAEGIKAGVVLDFDVSPYEMPRRFALPTAAYSDKTRKKLINFVGIGL